MGKRSIETADFHCDALSKMTEWQDMDFHGDPRLDVTAKRLREGSVRLQCFAIFLSEKWGTPQFGRILAQIEAYRKRIRDKEGFRTLLWREQTAQIAAGGQWALLSLEGADGLEGQMFYAQVLFELGVRFIGFTWNYANWAADGASERRNGGLTEKGRKLAEWCNVSGMLPDVSHLGEAGFWELLSLSSRPPIASHSNAYAVCPHPRNLRDEQIKALIACDGRIGLTFVPFFVKPSGTVQADDLLRHIEHVCALGGSKQLMFGSDFDGIETWIEGLEHPGCYPAFAERLLRHFSEQDVKGWMSGNALAYLQRQLPPMPN